MRRQERKSVVGELEVGEIAIVSVASSASSRGLAP
jgi:hypothetical protein